MPKFELSISPDYIPEWTEIDAVRELFQNALDQEKENPENEMSWTYNEKGMIFTISNKMTLLKKETLLLGSTNKNENKDLIGQFGEGYKLALLVLTRMGYPIKIFNYAEKEEWTPSIEKSRKYNKDILVINIKKIRFKRVPNNNLTFVIKQFTPELFENVERSNLHIKDRGKSVLTDQGSILFDPKHKGRIYVRGLFVCKEEEFEYGYDIKPEHIKIGRDRKLIASFDLQWVTSQMWNSSEKPLMVIKLIEQESPEVNHVDSTYDKSGIRDTAAAEFRSKYGNRAVPVSTQEELEKIMDEYPGLKPIITSRVYQNILYGYSEGVYKRAKVKIKKEISPEKILEKFYDNHKYQATKTMNRDLKAIIKQSKLWRWK